MWKQIIASGLCFGWVILVAVILLSWEGFGKSGQEYSGIIVPLFATGGLSLMPFGLWYSYRDKPETQSLLILYIVSIVLITVWLLILASSYRQPKGWTCTNRDHNDLVGFWVLALCLFGVVWLKLLLQDRSTVSDSELLLTQAGVLGLYATPLIAGLHCGYFGYQGDFVLGGILFIFMVTCTPILLYLGIIGVSRWGQMAFLPRVSTIMALIVGGSSCAYCMAIASILVSSG
jgi:hypothetical protein